MYGLEALNQPLSHWHCLSFVFNPSNMYVHTVNDKYSIHFVLLQLTSPKIRCDLDTRKKLITFCQPGPRPIEISRKLSPNALNRGILLLGIDNKTAKLQGISICFTYVLFSVTHSIVIGIQLEVPPFRNNALLHRVISRAHSYVFHGLACTFSRACISLRWTSL